MMRSLAFLLPPLLLAAAPPPAQVAVPGGLIEGVAEGAGNPLLFRGIPYAAAPIGALRWKAPRPVPRWTGVRAAKARAPACLQNDYQWNHADHVRSSEDCLTLDIATQTLTGRRPVMVWVHGGSNRAGSAGDTVKAALARRGVVLVAIQYRLGIFGFLSHRALAAEANGTSGNYGLMDQIAALRWVQDNIARFGGDPDNVTIFGESAGAQDVGLLLAAPAAAKLFARAILQSGTPNFGLPTRPLDRALRIGNQIDALTGSNGNIAPLRAASAAALLAADLRLHDESLESDDFLWLRPTIDGAILPDDPRLLLRDAPVRPVIIGSNRAEFGLPSGRAHRDANVDAAFGANAGKARAFYRLDDPDPAPDPRLGERDLRIATDIIFRCPAGRLADLLAEAGWPVWRYEFDLAPDGGRSFHGADIDYVMDGRSIGPGLSMQDYWLAFASGGKPAPSVGPVWPAYRPGRQHVVFDAHGVTPGAALAAMPCDWMDRI
ncbi:carboxylesterase/lipase family protein [Sphingobium sp. CAP-1]|uniref:carboxylesterase/lipase family protein n=1 Tax=Sphingobium sp. CAP-1 TaxID=2676077 RepID=UPI0018AD2C5A|nr:carboxylesterase family protein [Sphingobium sp. CAP-1]